MCRATAHSDCCFLAPCTNILTYLLNKFHEHFATPHDLLSVEWGVTAC